MKSFCRIVGVATAAYLAPSAGAAFIDNVSPAERADYVVVYELDIPTTSAGWNTAGVLTGAGGYKTNNAASIPNGSFDRVGYYFELDGATAAGRPNGWVFVTFDAAGFTNRADRTGVPSTTSAEFYQQNVSNMNVSSNVAGIVTGTGITTGNVEFWPSNYNQTNGRAAGSGGPVLNASATTYDFGDGGAGTSNGHASMQVHNYDIDGAGSGTAGQTLFAYNAWGAVRTSELGIGNNPTAGQAPDWTLTANAGSWTTKSLVVVVHVPEPGAVAVLGAAACATLAGRRRRRD
ncbi:MAG TPA: PEP-CTERM sorting domain-containing protein [Tepidisphaeraceae bacterium]|nr:PEP-CTERM sorting domain-containing protein [Tepidisphaeraceae bacterium]